jgi:hypothetical protein
LRDSKSPEEIYSIEFQSFRTILTAPAVEAHHGRVGGVRVGPVRIRKVINTAGRFPTDEATSKP